MTWMILQLRVPSDVCRFQFFLRLEGRLRPQLQALEDAPIVVLSPCLCLVGAIQ